MADVFLSYKNTPERRLFVRRLALVLRVNEISVWWDNSLGAGQKFKPEIAAEIEKAAVVVPLWCAKSIHSKWVNWEADLGRLKLAPAKLQMVSPPPAFSEIHAADLTGWDGGIRDSKIETFVQFLCNHLGGKARPAADLVDELSQLPKLEPLPLEDANANYFMRQIREAYIRFDPGYPDLDGAMALTLDSPLSDLFLEQDTAEARLEALWDFLSEVGFEHLICDDSNNLLLEPSDLNGVISIGQLAAVIDRKSESANDDDLDIEGYEDEEEDDL